MSSDERLAQRAASGDRGAFEAIYARYHQDLYRFCLAMVGNPDDAQDALQNAMVKVLRALPGEKRRIQLKPWLYRIARNEAVEVLRRRRDTEELGPDRAATGGVAESAETRERLRLLLADLDALPERQRAALVMRELAGLDFAQIAATFETSPAVARQTLYEARLNLRQQEAGREMRCADVMWELSDADGRVARRRDIRAHLRDCADCRAFREGIAARREHLGALAPLPIAASAGLLHAILGAKAGAVAGGGGLAGAVGAGAGKGIATSAIVKSAATVAVVGAVGVTVADRSDVVELPLGGRDGGAASRSAPPSAPSAGGGEATGGSAEDPHKRSVASGMQLKGDRALPAASIGAGKPSSGDGETGTSGSDEPAGTPSRSQSGSAPPGGGVGRSAAKRRGPPSGLPEAASHGQQAAASHKPAQAAEPPVKGARAGGRSKGAPGRSAPPPHSSQKAKPAPAHPEPPAHPAKAATPGGERPEAQPSGPSPGSAP